MINVHNIKIQSFDIFFGAQPQHGSFLLNHKPSHAILRLNNLQTNRDTSPRRALLHLLHFPSTIKLNQPLQQPINFPVPLPPMVRAHTLIDDPKCIHHVVQFYCFFGVLGVYDVS